MKMKYWVYENWLHNRAIIHKSDCSFCNEGKGRHPNKKYNSQRGHWLGPFKDKLEAQTVASRTKKEEVHDCGHCFRNQK